MSMKSMSLNHTLALADKNGNRRTQSSARRSILNAVIALIGAGFNAIVWGFAVAVLLDGRGAYIAVVVAAVVFVLSLVVFALLMCGVLGRPEPGVSCPDADAAFPTISAGDPKRNDLK